MSDGSEGSEATSIRVPFGTAETASDSGAGRLKSRAKYSSSRLS